MAAVRRERRRRLDEGSIEPKTLLQRRIACATWGRRLRRLCLVTTRKPGPLEEVIKSPIRFGSTTIAKWTTSFVSATTGLRQTRRNAATITKAKVKQFRTTRTKTMKSSPGLLKEEKLKTNGKWSIVCGISRRRRKICCTSPRTCR